MHDVAMWVLFAKATTLEMEEENRSFMDILCQEVVPHFTK